MAYDRAPAPVPDGEALLRCLRREATPRRVHLMELYLDEEVKVSLCERFGLMKGLSPDDPFFIEKREIRLQRALGYDYVRCRMAGSALNTKPWTATADTASLARPQGRSFLDEHRGCITSWEEFEAFEWPDPERLSTDALEWYSENLPEDMVLIGGGLANFAEYLSELMGYETLCFALYERRDLVAALSTRLIAYYRVILRRMLDFERVRLIWGSDDLGFKTGTLISPGDLRAFALPGHRLMAEMCHSAGRLYLLHSCGRLDAVMPDLLDDVRIDAKHSFEDTIERVEDAKRAYGRRIALLGGIDVDFLCRASESDLRARVRSTLETCMPGGGYCLGTGNSVANYIPVENYLIMLDEGRRFHP